MLPLGKHRVIGFKKMFQGNLYLKPFYSNIGGNSKLRLQGLGG